MCDHSTEDELLPGLISYNLMSVLVSLRRPVVYLCIVAALACRPVTGTTSATSSYIRYHLLCYIMAVKHCCL